MPARTPNHQRLLRWGTAVLAIALVAGACGDDDDDTSAGTSSPETTAASGSGTTTGDAGGSTTTGAGTGTTAGSGADGVVQIPSGPDLGPVNRATGEPVRIGYFNDGVTAAADQGDDTIVAEAVTDFWNEHMGGIAGRPIELVQCVTNTDPALATDCGNQFVEEDVVLVANGASAYSGEVFAPVRAAGIPFIISSTGSPEILTDPDLAFVLGNGSAASLAFPITVAVARGIDRVVTFIVDQPAALGGLPQTQLAADGAGVEWSYTAIPTGTPDMLPQVTAALLDDPGMVQLVGDPQFCLAGLNALYQADYQGTILTGDYCVSAEAFAPLPSERVQELVVSATVAMGDANDPDWQLYQAIMDEFASSTPEVNGVRGWNYQVMFTAFWGLRGIDPNDVTAATVTAELRAQPLTHQPLGHGITYLCDGTKFPPLPANCTDAALTTHLDAEGNFSGFELADTSVELGYISDGLLAGG